jgi:predicted Zn-dependent protease
MKKKVKKLNQQNSFHLQAAEGWFELGDLVSANNELDEISPMERAHPAVLILRYEIYARAGKWSYAAQLAETLLEILPEDSESWLNMAFTTRRKTGGSIDEAKRILLVAQVKFPREYLIPYNLACYCAQLGELKESKQWLKKAMLLNEKTVQKLAVDDSDLKPLWESMSGTIWRKE